MADVVEMPTVAFLLLISVLKLISVGATELTATTTTATTATTTAELKAVVFQNGSANATSSVRFKDWDQDWNPDRAFKRQSAEVLKNTRCVDSRPWMSDKISKDKRPTVFYRFLTPITVGAFSFRNRREPKHGANNPVDFDFVGSDDCLDWTTIKSVDNVTWTGNDQLKAWTIDEGDRRKFACFGIRVRTISGKRHAAIQDIRMEREEDCYVDNGVGYRGTIATSEFGRSCQNWESHEHTHNPQSDPSAGLESNNYCRNPSNKEKPWCYVTKSGQNSDGNYWEWCDIPKCIHSTGDCYIDNGVDYRGTIATSESGQSCQNWASHEHTHNPQRDPSAGLESNNYCRNPSNNKKPWCYVTKSGQNSDGNFWEWCNIPKCSGD